MRPFSRAPASGEFNQARGKVKELSYFGSFTLYHLQLESGFVLKVSQSNMERQRDDVLVCDDEAWACWSDTSQVVLTQ